MKRWITSSINYGVEKLVRATTLDVSKRVRMELNLFKGKITKDMINY